MIYLTNLLDELIQFMTTPPMISISCIFLKPMYKYKVQYYITYYTQPTIISYNVKVYPNK